jgi:cell division protein ZapA
MASKKSVSVTILDQNFNIHTDAAPEHVQKVADFVNANLKNVVSKSKNISPYNAAILAALNIAEKYFEIKEDESRFKESVRERSKKILGLLESAKSS